MTGLISSLLEWADSRAGLPPVGYRIRTVHWVLDMTSRGMAVAAYGQTDAVPAMRRSGPRPMPLLAVDSAAYVLGVRGPGTRAEQAAARGEAFWRQMEKWASADRHPAVVAALALAHTYDRAASPHEVPAGDRVAVRVEGIWLHRLPEAVGHWRELLTKAKGGPLGICIGCRQAQPLATSLPNAIPAHLVPGARHEAQLTVLPLTEREGGHLPVCVPCGDRASMALQTMLEDRGRVVRDRDRTTVVFGVGAGGADDAALAVLHTLGVQ
ncbi:MAG TPA: type I-C CRISPR-associated protein Cas8c/Csd1 [Micromonosporaceae bacterium]|nr:type I-C CRISPR-associated protein Cas8c/Csd1 [Micromonosporaceae bacterium]